MRAAGGCFVLCIMTSGLGCPSCYVLAGISGPGRNVLCLAERLTERRNARLNADFPIKKCFEPVAPTRNQLFGGIQFPPPESVPIHFDDRMWRGKLNINHRADLMQNCAPIALFFVVMATIFALDRADGNTIRNNSITTTIHEMKPLDRVQKNLEVVHQRIRRTPQLNRRPE